MQPLDESQSEALSAWLADFDRASARNLQAVEGGAHGEDGRPLRSPITAPPPLLLSAPAGGGRSQVLAHMAVHALLRGCRVLHLAPSGAAAQEAVRRAVSLCPALLHAGMWLGTSGALPTLEARLARARESAGAGGDGGGGGGGGGCDGGHGLDEELSRASRVCCLRLSEAAAALAAAQRDGDGAQQRLSELLRCEAEARRASDTLVRAWADGAARRMGAPLEGAEAAAALALRAHVRGAATGGGGGGGGGGRAEGCPRRCDGYGALLQVRASTLPSPNPPTPTPTHSPPPATQPPSAPTPRLCSTPASTPAAPLASGLCYLG